MRIQVVLPPDSHFGYQFRNHDVFLGFHSYVFERSYFSFFLYGCSCAFSLALYTAYLALSNTSSTFKISLDTIGFTGQCRYMPSVLQRLFVAAMEPFYGGSSLFLPLRFVCYCFCVCVAVSSLALYTILPSGFRCGKTKWLFQGYCGKDSD